MNILEPFISDPLFNIHKDYYNEKIDIRNMLQKVEFKLAGTESLENLDKFATIEE